MGFSRKKNRSHFFEIIIYGTYQHSIFWKKPRDQQGSDSSKTLQPLTPWPAISALPPCPRSLRVCWWIGGRTIPSDGWMVVSEVGKLHDHDFGDIITVDCTCLLKKTFIVFAWWKQMQYLNLSSSLSILGNILVPASPSFFCPKDLTSSKFLGGCATYENEDFENSPIWQIWRDSLFQQIFTNLLTVWLLKQLPNMKTPAWHLYFCCTSSQTSTSKRSWNCMNATQRQNV